MPKIKRNQKRFVIYEFLKTDGNIKAKGDST